MLVTGVGCWPPSWTSEGESPNWTTSAVTLSSSVLSKEQVWLIGAGTSQEQGGRILLGLPGQAGKAPGAPHEITVSGSAWPCPPGRRGVIVLRQGRDRVKQAPERKEALGLQVEANRDTSLVFVSLSPEFSSHRFLSVSLSYEPLFFFGFLFPPFPITFFLGFSRFLFPWLWLAAGIPIWYPTQSCDEGFSLCTLQILGCVFGSPTQ